MKNMTIAALTGIALFLSGPAAAKETEKTRDLVPATQIVTVQPEDAKNLQANRTPEQTRFERGRSKLDQKAERKNDKKVFRGRVEPLLIVHDF